MAVPDLWLVNPKELTKSTDGALDGQMQRLGMMSDVRPQASGGSEGKALPQSVRSTS